MSEKAFVYKQNSFIGNAISGIRMDIMLTHLGQWKSVGEMEFQTFKGSDHVEMLVNKTFKRR